MPEQSYIRVTYLFSGGSPFDAEKKAKSIALGQTTDTWTPLSSKDLKTLEKHRGVVLSVGQVEHSDSTYRCKVIIGFPPGNTEGDIPTLLTMVFGKVSLDGKIKLLDIDLPKTFLSRMARPKYGVDGMRRITGVADRPLAMAIFKPCVGLSAAELGDMFYQTALGGADLIKDDEILPNIGTAPVEQRLEACLKSAQKAQMETHQHTLYAVNLTGPVTNIFEQARWLSSLGANCFLLNVLSYGYSVLEGLAKDSQINVPIMAHPAVSGGLSSSPEYGISYKVTLGKLMRAGGADMVLFPSSYGTVAMPTEEAFRIRDALTEPMGSLPKVFPGPSAGIHPGLVPQIVADYGKDVIINAGGGVHGHPMGSRAGMTAVRQAIDLCMKGYSLGKMKANAPAELKEALALWSK
ncbi:MAG: 2,3-diketo-5-methylthiopentyl-1-phosphate enolase [Dehalococcoidia bacterium]|nr:2,3-diketo-5-methylthiopentyl-1-phosphate enolase [Dehalococcoidia bacterium]